MSQGEDNTGSGLSGEINIILFASLGISFLQEKEDWPSTYAIAFVFYDSPVD